MFRAPLPAGRPRQRHRHCRHPQTATVACRSPRVLPSLGILCFRSNVAISARTASGPRDCQAISVKPQAAWSGTSCNSDQRLHWCFALRACVVCRWAFHLVNTFLHSSVCGLRWFGWPSQSWRRRHHCGIRWPWIDFFSLNVLPPCPHLESIGCP